MNINITPEEARVIISSLRKNDILAEKLQLTIDELTKLNRQGFVVNNGKINPYSTTGFAQSQLCWRTEEQASAARALAELTQHYGNVPKEDKTLTSIISIGYVIYNSPYNGGIRVYAKKDFDSTNSFLAFNNEKAAQNFLDSHKTLIEQAKYFL